MPNYENMTRRDFLVYGTATAGFILIPAHRAEAFWPGLVLRFLIGGGIRRTASRTAFSAARSLAGRSTGRAATRSSTSIVARSTASSTVRRTSMKKVTSLGITGGIVVSPDIFAMAKESNAEAIWVQNNHENELGLVMENPDGKRIQDVLTYMVEDVETREIEYESKPITVYSMPEVSPFKFASKVKNLPHTGIKRIVGDVRNSSFECEPSGNIVIATGNDVELEK